MTVEDRQLWRCGFEPPLPARLEPYALPLFVLGETVKLTICPGYTANLPEVVEIARARFHGEKTSLREFCGGQPHEAIFLGIEILEGAYCEARDWASKNPVKT